MLFFISPLASSKVSSLNSCVPTKPTKFHATVEAITGSSIDEPGLVVTLNIPMIYSCFIAVACPFAQLHNHPVNLCQLFICCMCPDVHFIFEELYLQHSNPHDPEGHIQHNKLAEILCLATQAKQHIHITQLIVSCQMGQSFHPLHQLIPAKLRRPYHNTKSLWIHPLYGYWSNLLQVQEVWSPLVIQHALNKTSLNLPSSRAALHHVCWPGLPILQVQSYSQHTIQQGSWENHKASPQVQHQAIHWQYNIRHCCYLHYHPYHLTDAWCRSLPCCPECGPIILMLDVPVFSTFSKDTLPVLINCIAANTTSLEVQCNLDTTTSFYFLSQVAKIFHWTVAFVYSMENVAPIMLFSMV